MIKEINYNKTDLFGTLIQLDLFGIIEADKASILEDKDTKNIYTPNNLFDRQTTFNY